MARILQWVVGILAVALVIVVLGLLLSKPRARLAVLNGSSLDFLPDGHSAYTIFSKAEEGSHNLLFTQQRPIVERDITPETVEAVCEELYGQGVRMYTGLLESAILLHLVDFALRHPDVVIVSASSTIPRQNLLPPNMFRVMGTDVAMIRALPNVITSQFGSTVTRISVVNGSPGNVWADAMAALVQGMLASSYTIATALTNTEQAGTPRTDTVYLYMGDRAHCTLPSVMSADAKIVIVSGTGWEFEVTAERNYMEENQVYSIDTMNSTKALQAATMRTEKLSPFLGTFLQALNALIAVDNVWNGRMNLTHMLEVTYGAGGSLLFTPSHDGNVEGLYVQRLQATSCSNCILDAIGGFFVGAATFVVNVVTESDVISCGIQAATCASALGAAINMSINHHDLIRACKPLFEPFDDEDPCMGLITGLSSDCMRAMKTCVTEVNCNPALPVCTTDMITDAVGDQFDRIIPFSLFSFLFG